MPTYACVHYDPISGLVTWVTKGRARQAAAQLAALQAIDAHTLIVDPAHEVVTHPGRWVVANGALTRKTQVDVVASTDSLSVVVPTTDAPPPVPVLVQLPLGPATPVDGVAAVTLPAGSRVHVAAADPRYFSMPAIVQAAAPATTTSTSPSTSS